MEDFRHMLLVWIREAESGVDYIKGHAICPACGSRLYVKTTRPWEGNTRIRYHICKAEHCGLAAIAQHIKSIETRVVEGEVSHAEQSDEK